MLPQFKSRRILLKPYHFIKNGCRSLQGRIGTLGNTKRNFKGASHHENLTSLSQALSNIGNCGISTSCYEYRFFIGRPYYFWKAHQPCHLSSKQDTLQLA